MKFCIHAQKHMNLSFMTTTTTVQFIFTRSYTQLFITINCNLLSFSRKNSRHVINSAEKGGLLNSVILVSGWKWSKDQAWRYLRFMRISVYVYVLILSAITPVFFCTTRLDTQLWISKPRFLYSDVLFMDFYYYTNPIQWSHAVLHTVI